MTTLITLEITNLAITIFATMLAVASLAAGVYFWLRPRQPRDPNRLYELGGLDRRRATIQTLDNDNIRQAEEREILTANLRAAIAQCRQIVIAAGIDPARLAADGNPAGQSSGNGGS